MAEATRGRVRVEQSPKRVRAYLGGELVLDTLAPRLVWEVPYFPSYYVPVEHVRARLVPAEKRSHSPSRGDAEYFDVHAGGRVASESAYAYTSSPIEELRGLVRFEWDALDEWLEEDEPVYVHPHDPYTRIDILASSRRVQVAVDGVEVADSDQPRVLFETGLPPRYYVPISHVRTELLRPSATVTRCPYKGTASYWSIEIDGRRYEDYVWTYRSPFAECAKIAGLVCFYNEKVDITLGGVTMERPRSHFS
ncbi:MAG TPA: DUF427 domain-containing protein [Acidimicrobiales bacterium]|nr:DUF427 domain-containing protein [Acidimicrobiales bacterium]